MKRFSTMTLALSFLVVFLIFFPVFANADPGGGGCDPLNPGCPIDGGLIALLAIGVGYGIKKYYDFKRTSSQLDKPVSE